MDCPDRQALQVCWGHRVRLVSKVNEVCKANKARPGRRENEDRQDPLVSTHNTLNMNYIRRSLVDINHMPVWLV